jgi:predicted ArsR family transcriptional regulator
VNIRQGDLLYDIQPKARKHDPITSHDAAASMRRAATNQAAAALDCLRACGPLGAEQIGWSLRLPAYAVRKRLSELQDAGLAAPTDKRRKTVTGRSERVWEAA